MIIEKPRVMIAIPNLGEIDTRLVMKLMRWTVAPTNWAQVSVVMPIGHIPHDSARNYCIDQFLGTDDTHLFFVDADVVPPNDALHKLLEADKDVISGLYPTVWYDKTKMEFFRRHNVFSHIEKDGELVEAKGKDIQKIAHAGGGCLLIKRHVIEAMTKPYFLFEYNDDGIMITGEDVYFGKKTEKMGIKTFAHFDVVCNHIKKIVL